jgi:hypothetical protein
LVSARVAFMPMSQSDWARQAAESASPSNSSPGRSCEKPWRIASSVIDWSQRRWMGLFEPRLSTISRKISSPSRPASQALTMRSTSSRAICARMVRMRSRCPFFGL